MDNRIGTKENADFILVSNNQAHPTGFITLIDKQTYIQIGLVAVDSNFRGIGIGEINPKGYIYSIL